ncbi:MAG: hypothetical protein SFY95_04080 [Planctomycetota bacterium]|nr:hypothetical protein [Planctomycetota bacterium]
MGTSEKTFQQVKAILGKLDRSIDSLRAQRTGDAPGRDASTATAQPTGAFAGNPLNQTVGSPAPAANAQSASAQSVGGSSAPTLIGAPAPSPAFNRPASPFGRATPIRPTGS